MSNLSNQKPTKEWFYTPGILAWVKRKSSSQTSDPLWWPSIIYPSWSFAASQSGFMTEGQSDDSSSPSSPSKSNPQGILIEGCKKSVRLEHLCKNMVPKRVALGSARMRGGANTPTDKLPLSTKRRVVAHYLGLDTQKHCVANWAAIDPSSTSNIQLYTIQNSKRFYLSYKNKIHPHDWNDFMLGIKEASVAMTNNSYDPSIMFRELMEDLSKNKDQKEDEPTPEFYADWTTQSQSQSQSQKMTQFSQGNFLAPNLNRLPNMKSDTDETKIRKDQKRKRGNDNMNHITTAQGNELESVDTNEKLLKRHKKIDDTQKNNQKTIISKNVEESNVSEDKVFNMTDTAKIDQCASSSNTNKPLHDSKIVSTKINTTLPKKDKFKDSSAGADIPNEITPLKPQKQDIPVTTDPASNSTLTPDEEIITQGSYNHQPPKNAQMQKFPHKQYPRIKKIVSFQVDRDLLNNGKDLKQIIEESEDTENNTATLLTQE